MMTSRVPSDDEIGRRIGVMKQNLCKVLGEDEGYIGMAAMVNLITACCIDMGMSKEDFLRAKLEAWNLYYAAMKEGDEHVAGE